MRVTYIPIMLLTTLFSCSNQNEAEIVNKIQEINKHKMDEISRFRAIIDVEVERNKTETNEQQRKKIIWRCMSQKSVLAKINHAKNYQEIEDVFNKWQTEFEDTFQSKIDNVQNYSNLSPELAKEFIRYDIYVASLTQINKEIMLIN
ncbi:MAG: hypothetical protein AAF843_08130 [Bacteroidota bacterium]